MVYEPNLEHPKWSDSTERDKARRGGRRERDRGERKKELAKRATMICGACERDLPEASYSQEQGRLRQSVRRCEECVAEGNQLVLMKKGRTRSEDDECPICNLLLPLT